MVRAVFCFVNISGNLIQDKEIMRGSTSFVGPFDKLIIRSTQDKVGSNNNEIMNVGKWNKIFIIVFQCSVFVLSFVLKAVT